jgi:hypothetical protein
MKAKYRVTVLATHDSTEYLVDKVIESKETPRQIVQRYLKKYPNVHAISAEEQNPYRLHRYSQSTCLF